MSLKDYILEFTPLVRCQRCNRWMVYALPEHGLFNCVCGWPMRVYQDRIDKYHTIEVNSSPLTIHELLS